MVRTCGPYQEEASISSLLKLRHQAVNNMRFGCNDIHGIHIALGHPSVLKTFDVWQMLDNEFQNAKGTAHS